MKETIETIEIIVITIGIILLATIITFFIGYGIGFIIQFLIGHQIVYYGLSLPQITGILFVIFKFFSK